jgi:hypothetical protein
MVHGSFERNQGGKWQDFQIRKISEGVIENFLRALVSLFLKKSKICE